MVLFISASDVLTPSPVAPPQFPGVWAVLVGVDNYADPEIPDLMYAGRDARAMLGALMNSYANNSQGGAHFERENVLLLCDGGDLSPTAVNLRYALSTWIPERAGRNDLVIIFLSGHGFPDADPASPDGVSRYFVTMDADLDELSATAVSFSEIANSIAYIPSEHVLTIVDACFTVVPGAKALPGSAAGGDEFWGELSSATGKIALTSSAFDQPSLELAEFESGLFTYYLIEGLSGFADANRDGILSVGELFVYTRARVKVSAARYGLIQIPQAAAVTMLISDYALLTTREYKEPVALLDRMEVGGAVLTPGVSEELPELEDALGRGRLVIGAPARLSFARIVTDDGRDLGSNPLPLILELPPGKYRITIGARSLLPLETSIELHPGRVSVLPPVHLLSDPEFEEPLPDEDFPGEPEVVRRFLEGEGDRGKNGDE